MGWKVHTTLKCHTCPARKALGGTKKMGSRTAVGWKCSVKIKTGDYVTFCPACYLRYKLNESKQ